MDIEQYLQMCEQMGWEPNEDEMPKDPSHLSYNVQSALILYNALPDIWEGMSGTWMGKDYSGLMDIMNIYEIDNKKEAFTLFEGLLNKIKHDVIKFLFNLNIVIEKEKEKTDNQVEIPHDNKKVGRNEKCPCGSGKKYKHCCGSV